MKFSRPRRTTLSLVRIPLVALIDVVLFLLMYFIMAGELASSGERWLSSTLRTDQRATATNLQAQVLRVEQALEGVVYSIGGRRVTSTPELMRILRALPKQAGVLVRVAGEVPVEHAARAVQACRDAGFERVSYVPTTR